MMQLKLSPVKLDPKKLPKILSIIVGSLLALILIFIGFKLMSGVFTKASDSAPREVIITAITQNTAKLAWSTDQETQGVIEYGTSPTALNFFAPESVKGQKHSVDLSLLSPGTTYYFQVRIGDQKYDNAGVPWSFATKAKGEAAVSGTPVPSASPAPTSAPTHSSSANAGPIIRPTSGISVNLPKPTNTPVPLPTLASFVCGETDCLKICQKIGKTCSSQDWMRSGCVGKVALSNCTTIVPTNTPAPTAVPTATPTPTVAPTTTPTPSPTPSSSSSSSSSSS